MRGATDGLVNTFVHRIFQSTLLMRGATRRAGASLLQSHHFNPRSSCEERRFAVALDCLAHYFNPRSSCEERRALNAVNLVLRVISIHAPHARSDHVSDGFAWCQHISIHAPHARSDSSQPRPPIAASNFNPRSSCEERHWYRADRVDARRISIHAPHARSDARRVIRQLCNVISIHAPHARSDTQGAQMPAVPQISIHAPHARSDHSWIDVMRNPAGFQSTLLMRGATAACLVPLFDIDISIHAPHARSDRRLPLTS